MKISLVGANGYWCGNYIRTLKELGVEIGLLCDKNIVGLEKYNLPVTDSLDEVMKSNCDGVIICTPYKTHYSIVKDLLLSSKHILCEKTFTETVEQAEELIGIAEANNLKLLVGQTFLYNSLVQKTKEIIDSGELGKLLYITFQRTGKSPIRFDCNSLADLGSHDLSMLLYWLDEMPLSVASFGQAYLQKDIEDVCFVNLKFSNNVIANIHCSWYEPVKKRCVTVVGDKKMLTLDDIAQTLIIHDNEGEHKVDVKYLQPLTEQVDDFINCIINDEEPLSDGYVGRDVVRILEYCQTALKQ